MEHFDLFLTREDAMSVEQVLEAFVDATGSQMAMIVGRDGTLVAKCGTCTNTDIDSMCAIAAGAFASSEALANIAGENAFNAIAHQGSQSCLFITSAGSANLLVVLYDRMVNSALIRLQAKITAESIIHLLERIYNREEKERRVQEITICNVPLTPQGQ